MQNSQTQFYEHEDRFDLAGGGSLNGFTLAYETWGHLNEARDNAVLVYHALSGSQHAAGFNPSVPGAENLWNETCHTGWWDAFVGPGKAVNPERYFILCANYLGGCYGSTGPRSIDPATGNQYGGDFPRISLSDIVDSQMALLDHLQIDRLHAVVGSSLGGCLALTTATRYPERVGRVAPIACGLEVPILTRIHNLEQICAIEEDPNFQGGHYYDGTPPHRGLALARMIAHKTYISLDTIVARSKKEIRSTGPFDFYRVANPVESYILYAGEKFVQRFDPNTYLRILDAWQRFDLAESAGATSIRKAFKKCRHQNYLVISIDSDVCFYPGEQREIVRTLKEAGILHRYITVHSENGHDAFLLEPDLFTGAMAHWLEQEL